MIKYCDKSKYTDMPDLFSIATTHNEKITVYPIHEYWIDVGNESALQKPNIHGLISKKK